MSYDQWKTATPEEFDKEDECLFCGEPCNGNYCDDSCSRADISERT